MSDRSYPNPETAAEIERERLRMEVIKADIRSRWTARDYQRATGKHVPYEIPIVHSNSMRQDYGGRGIEHLREAM